MNAPAFPHPIRDICHAPQEDGLSVEMLIEQLAIQGTDRRTIERARQVAHEAGQRMDTVLLQLGLVSERQMAEAGAALLGTTVAPADGYPASLPEVTALLTPRYLRAARCLPIAGDAHSLILAVADPL